MLAHESALHSDESGTDTCIQARPQGVRAETVLVGAEGEGTPDGRMSPCALRTKLTMKSKYAHA